MIFRWKALALAPLVVPFMFSLALSIGVKNPVAAFLIFFVLSSIFCYGVTLVLFVPALFCLSKFTTLQFHKVCVLGTLLGILVFLPMSWMFYISSGPDSGPPEGTFVAYLWRSLSDTFNLAFPLGGLITVMAYWHLAKERALTTVQEAIS